MFSIEEAICANLALEMDVTVAGLLRLSSLHSVSRASAPALSESVHYSTLHFNVKAQRYHLPKGATSGISKPGQFLSAAAVRSAIEEDIQREQSAMSESMEPLKALARQRMNGEITQREWGAALDQFRTDQAQRLKNLHLNYVAAARGGFHGMSQASYGRAGGFLNFHYGKLDNFIMDMSRDPAIVVGESSGRMAADRRLGMYAKTALFTFEAERVMSHLEQGYTQKRNVHHSQESCEGCQIETAKGWHSLHEGVPIGKRIPCGPADLCTWDFK